MRPLLLILFLLCAFASIATGQPVQANADLKSITYYKSVQPDTAFYLARSLYRQAQKSNDQLQKAKYALELGEILYYLGDFDNASSYLIEAINIYEKTNDKRQLALAYTWQGIVVQYARQYQTAWSYYQKALQLYQKLNDSVKIGEIYGWIGHYYEKTLQTDTALLYQHKAKNILHRQGKHSLLLANIYDNLGSIYEDKAQFDSAHYYFLTALEINRSFHEENRQIVNLNNIGDIFRKKGQYEKALIYTDSAFQLAKKNNLDYQMRAAHRDFSKIYARINSYEKAYNHLETSYNIYTDILNEENVRRIALLQTVYETERKENQISLLEKDKRFNRLLQYGMLCLFAVVVLAAFLMIRGQKLKMRQNKKIIDQKTQLFKKQQELTRLELKNAQLNEEKLKAELDNQKFKENELQQNIVLKSQLITSHTLQIIRKNNFLEKLKNELQQIKKSEKTERIHLINGLMKSIMQDIKEDENWHNFNMIFSQVHKDFFANLKNRYADISPSELRLCALLKLNLHSQDIATILGVSNDSLRIARYRLKKKLQLGKNGNLISFLINI